ncbi:DUF5359 family protein [Aquibacillus albus]|uniref:Uncharacterized protein n=1 Tax=Aquibacillus albus TaxID=1168171 RepID=A0ABS2MV85_9BACI|nr:DUF5359 family protein [Aquibacillus albus]MBM7569809.1 hypothetical protein [Aquibacillus albus]
MKRLERYIIVTLFAHGLLLIVSQWVIQHFELNVYIDPIYQYLGVFKKDEQNHLETLDYFFQNVLSF